MKNSNRNQMTREQQEAQCWEEYYASNKTPEQIEAEIDRAWKEHLANQDYDSEGLSEDSEEGSTHEEETTDEDSDSDEPDMRIYRRRKKTADCHKALCKKAEVAKRSIRKRQEDDAKSHRKKVLTEDDALRMKRRKCKKLGVEFSGELSKEEKKSIAAGRASRATSSKSGRAMKLVKKVEVMGFN